MFFVVDYPWKYPHTRGTRRDLKHHYQKDFGIGVDLTTFLYSVFDGESGKIISRSWKKGEIENFVYFEKRCDFSKNDFFRVFRIFRPKESIW